MRRTLLFMLVCLAAACNTTDSDPFRYQSSAPLPNLSGHWEKDFQRSDDFANKVALYSTEVRYRQSPQVTDSRGSVVGGGLNINAINGLLRFTEALTQALVLEIDQGAEHITIERDEDFPLRCQFGEQRYRESSNTFGQERCGWRAGRFFMNMALGDGLLIDYQFTLSPDGERLNVTTSVSSELARVPLVISNVYERYTPPDHQVDCFLTLTRNQVCRQRPGS